MTKPATEHAPSDSGLWLIAFFKLIKGLLLMAVGFGTFQLIHQDAAKVLGHWAEQLHLATNNRYLQIALVKLVGLDDRSLELISATTFSYAALLLAEGVGLFMKKIWAEYLTVVSTSSFIPLEIYELAKNATWLKAAVIVINIAVVWYLILRLRWERHHHEPALR